MTHYGSAASSESAAPPEEEGEPVRNVPGESSAVPRGAKRAGGQRLQGARQLRQLIAAEPAEAQAVVAAHRRAPAQELLDLALVLEALAGPGLRLRTRRSAANACTVSRVVARNA